MTDPIADMLTRMRNALATKKAKVVIPMSKIKLDIAKILERDGWIEKMKKEDDQIIVKLKYNKEDPVITLLKRISKPGCRIYAKSKEMPIVLDHLGIAIISTPQGLMTNKEAKRKKVGGEVLCEIY
ncbi:30S ribosomal protein S8 [Candidatus Falkowbacteria bacterium]|jgi:small subunit ribosomal protein S8|nr:30S ribosomal protein S8 [Candidatus Falkowbacteria bacterium]MBT4433008.1 30S ribosomal protein S8 [Candidatus Falkowbacteria bacterium]